MHQEARCFVLGVSAALGKRKKVVEFGSYNVNGTARDLFEADEWHGIDIKPGPGVDEVADAAHWDCGEDDWGPDTIICMECLEHAPEARQIVLNAYENLGAGGVFVMTCAGVGREPHSATGDRPVPAGEYYGNVSAEQMMLWLAEAGFSGFTVAQSDDRCTDLYAVARK